MRDDSASNTGNVTTEEGDTGLSEGRVLILGLGQLGVDSGDSVLEGSELNHSVRDLAGPEGNQTTVETAHTVSGKSSGETGEDVGSEGRDGGLGLDLNGLPGAEQDISEELSRGRGNEEQGGLVLVSSLLTDEVGVLVLEKLVQTVLTGTLEGVTDKGSTETSEDSRETLSADDSAEGVEVTLVEGLVDLQTALHEIKGGNGSVSRTASEDTTDGAVLEVLSGVEGNDVLGLNSLGDLVLNELDGLLSLLLSRGNPVLGHSRAERVLQLRSSREVHHFL